MNSRFTVVETNLNRAEFRWKWLRILRVSSLLGILVCVGLIGLGLAISHGWLSSRAVAFTVLAILLAVGFGGLAIAVIGILVGSPDRQSLAAAIERKDMRLLDRLNTLLFLETRRGEARAERFAVQIARQTQGIVSQKAPPLPYPVGGSYAWLLGLLATVALTAFLGKTYSPWDRLVGPHRVKVPNQAPDKPLELALPDTNNVEQNQAWGEVRITDPGTDLKVTKIDVVPLQIEAAANQNLKGVRWFSTVNGAEQATHELPSPSEPRYAVYQPLVYLDELNLSDWDVLTYYAKAETTPQNSYASEVYFLEVRPFREDILKLPGGEGGKAYQTLNEITSLINRQQHVIRQTHQHVQKPPQQDNLRAQERGKLSAAEDDLGDSARHVYAQMAAEMENQSIGEALDNLAKAESSLGAAGKTLRSNIVNEAQSHERSALAELVAARKSFQKAVTDHPENFEENNQEDTAPATDSAKSLGQIAEFRDEAKAARDFVRLTLEQQKSLEQQSRTALRNEYPRLAAREEELQKALQDFAAQHRPVFSGTQAESRRTDEAMNQAAAALQRRQNDAKAELQQATRELQNFNQAMQKQSAEQQLADSYKLKRMLDNQIQDLDRRSKPDSKMSDDQLQHLTKEARDTLDQLKKAAEQEPTRNAFGPPLRDALGGQNKVELDAKLLRLEQAQDESAKQQGAAAAKDGLGKVKKAFEESQPSSLQMAHKSDSLKPEQGDSLATGMAELQSLLRQLERNQQPTGQDQAKQGQQALFNLQTGMRSRFGDNDQGNQLLLQLEQLLKNEAGLEPGNLKQLLTQLEQFSAEASAQLAKSEDQPELKNIDPARLPPAYRSRIQKYFQKLSEK